MPSYQSRRPLRLPDHDYTEAGFYFVTLCTQNRACLLGTVVEGVMRPNPAGQMMADVWTAIPERHAGVDVDEMIVMPNHLHGIVVLLSGERGEPIAGGHGLPAVMQRFKALTTTEYIKGVRSLGWRPFAGRLWQRSYFERVIRNERELQAVREYIRRNPAGWQSDRENPVGSRG